MASTPELGWSDSAEGRRPNRPIGRTNFKSDSHALKMGMFVSFLRERWGYVDIVLDTDGNYTPRIDVRGAPFGKIVIEVLPPEEEAG